jgi:hypothetical protein
MSEKLMVCKALAAMIRKKGEPDEEAISFIAHAAFDLGLTSEENNQVQEILRQGGVYDDFIKEIVSSPMRSYFFRRVVAATLLDEKIEDDEIALIEKTAEAFGYQEATVISYLDWMKEGLKWEKRGAEIMRKLELERV